MRLEDVHIRDPFIFLENNRKFLFGTTDPNPWEGPGKGFDCYEIFDDGTVTCKTVFTPSNSFWGKCNYWAPEVYKYKNKYIMVASFKGNNRGVQLLVSNQPDGEYKPVGNKSITPENQECLDGTLWEEDGKLFLIYSHEWIQCYDGEMCIAEVAPDYSQLINAKVLFKASDAEWTIENVSESKRGYVTDGPYIYQLSKGRLAMIWSSFSKRGYAIGAAYSDAGIMGPWVQEKEPLFDSDGGHGMIYSHKDKKLLVFHSPNILGKERVSELEIFEHGNRLLLRR